MRQRVAAKATYKETVGSRRWRVYRFETRRRARRPGGRQMAISAKLLIFLGKMDTGPARDSCAPSRPPPQIFCEIRGIWPGSRRPAPLFRLFVSPGANKTYLDRIFVVALRIQPVMILWRLKPRGLRWLSMDTPASAPPIRTARFRSRRCRRRVARSFGRRRSAAGMSTIGPNSRRCSSSCAPATTWW